jgi:hypothetical protein
VIVRPVWRPAIVAFFGFGGGNYGGGFSFNVAFGNVGWVPLAPFEPYHPWWGPNWVNHTTVVNNYTTINNITNVNITRVYRNAAVPGGVAVVHGNNLTNGSDYHYVPVHADDLKDVTLVKSALPVVPTRQALSFTKGPSNQGTPVTPLSTRFASMPTSHKLPPSFGQQQAAVQTVAGTGAHPSTSGSTSSAWSRFNNSNGQTSDQWHAYDWSKGGKNASGDKANGVNVGSAGNGGNGGSPNNNGGKGSTSGGGANGKKKTTTHHGSHPSGGSPGSASPPPH